MNGREIAKLLEKYNKRGVLSTIEIRQLRAGLQFLGEFNLVSGYLPTATYYLSKVEEMNRILIARGEHP